MFQRKLPDNAFDVRLSEEGDISLVGVNPDFLESKAKAIIKYTAQAYPDAKIPDIKEIKVNNFQIKTKEGYTCAIRLNPILPPLVAKIMELSGDDHFRGMNCHGAAAVAAGLFPVVTVASGAYPPETGYTKVPAKELSAGDIIRLETDHSFVFIDNDICLSANGPRQPLTFHRTEEVLDRYQYPKDVLTTHSKDFNVYRRDKGHTFSELIIADLMEYYQIKTTMPCYLSDMEGYELLEKVMVSLYENCLRKNKGNATLELIYEMTSDDVPWRLNESVKNHFKPKKGIALSSHISF